jgi:hypothetical protein
VPISQIGHIALKFSNYKHTGRKGSTMSEISIYRALFPRQMLSISIIIYYSQSVTPFPVLFQLLCSVCLFYSWCSILKSTFKVSSSCVETFQLYPAALLHTPTWLFGLKEAIVSNSFILLSPFWFLNWKALWYHLLLCRNPLFAQSDTTLLGRSLI